MIKNFIQVKIIYHITREGSIGGNDVNSAGKWNGAPGGFSLVGPEVKVWIHAGLNNTQIATEIVNALTNHEFTTTPFTATSTDNIVTITNQANGNATNPTDSATNVTVGNTDGDGSNPEEVTLTIGSSALGNDTPSGHIIVHDNDNNPYWIWFALTSTDPSPGGTGIQVEIGDAARTYSILKAIKIAVEAGSFPFTVSYTYVAADSDVATITITNTENGVADNGSISDANMPTGGGGTTVSVTQVGSAGQPQIYDLTVPDGSNFTGSGNANYIQFTSGGGSSYYLWFNRKDLTVQPAIPQMIDIDGITDSSAKYRGMTIINTVNNEIVVGGTSHISYINYYNGNYWSNINDTFNGTVSQLAYDSTNNILYACSYTGQLQKRNGPNLLTGS